MLHSATVEHARTSGALGAAKNSPAGGWGGGGGLPGRGESGDSWSARCSRGNHGSPQPWTTSGGPGLGALIQHLRICDIIPAGQVKGRG